MREIRQSLPDPANIVQLNSRNPP